MVLLAHVSTALGAGKITGLTLNPPDVKTCTFETITVRGTGKCSDVTVFFGDGNKLITLGKPKPFPQTFHHVYSKGGLTRLSAQAYTGPGSTCTGKASKTVQIAAGPSPTITSMFTLGFFFSSDATPGALIILQGENFGDLPGQVWIHLKDYQGNASDHLLLDTQKYWHDTFVAGIVPDITGVLDQQATVTVVAQCGAVGNAQTVNFTADRDVADLAQLQICSSVRFPPGASVSDQCMGWGGSNWPEECGLATWGALPTDFGLGGYHASGYGFQGKGGSDQFWVTTPLQHGWVLDSSSADWSLKVGDVSQASKDSNASSAPGDPSPKLGVNWYVGNCGMVVYYGSMIIIGPVGVPY